MTKAKMPVDKRPTRTTSIVGLHAVWTVDQNIEGAIAPISSCALACGFDTVARVAL